MVWDNRKLTVFFAGFIIVGALLMVTVVQSAIISRQVNKEYKRRIEEIRKEVDSSAHRLRTMDSIYAGEIRVLHGEVLQMSYIREMNKEQIDSLQELVEREQQRRDSLGNSLLDW